MIYLASLVAAYLIGSISCGLIVGRLARDVDVRNYGSGATGMTNVLRTLGPRMAALVLIGDLTKGIVAAAIAISWADLRLIEAVAGILVVAGHNWPVFSKFHGGRGVTTALGVLVVISPIVAVAAVALFIPIVAITRYVSMGSLAAVILSMLLIPSLVLAGLAPWEYLIYSFCTGPLIIWKHRENIQRLLQGTERRIGQDVVTQEIHSSEKSKQRSDA